MFTYKSLMLSICIILILNFILLCALCLIKKVRRNDFDTEGQMYSSNNYQNCVDQHREIIEKLDELLRKEKLYTKCDLSLNEIAEILGTNRTYVSVGINSFYKKNFSSYLNTYRWDELQNTIQEDDLISNKELATKCGFGSVDSMKRIIKQETGLTLKEWRDQICEENELL